ncbi:MAG: metallophosphoesterase family protein [Tepidanaerobacteraceae bacterium]|nr:metallophosphoesterase family protein [Tepidanaerobacteraceae bacterium]
MSKKIGIVSDTHGLLRKEALMALKGCEMIIHAGDIGRPEIIYELESIAPVIAVRGNVDRGIWAQELPITEVVDIESIKLFVIHDISTMDIDPKASGFKVVIYGHSQESTKRRVYCVALCYFK